MFYQKKRYFVSLLTNKTIIMRLFILTLFFTLSTVILNAQDWSTENHQYGKLYKGYVIDTEGNKIEGFIKYRNRYIMQLEVIFFKVNDSKSPKKKYLAQNLVEYKVADKLYRVIPHSGGVGVLKRGNLVVKDGCVTHYIWYKRSSNYNKLKKRQGELDEDYAERKFPSTRVYYKKGDERAVEKAYFKEDYSKKLSKYLSLNKVLAKKVKSKQNGYTDLMDLDRIFDEYNEACH